MSGPRMYPAVLPRAVLSDRYRSAEVKVFHRLQETLDPDWTVFYSRPWLGLTRTGGERDGECDFVVAHPRRGFLAIEVKGGGISYDPLTEDWISRDRHGVRHRISNPIEQAKKAKYELDRRLKTSRGFPSTRNYRMRHGVVFPDAEAPPGNLGADRPRDLFCCHDDLPRIGEWVERRLAGGDEEDFGRDGVVALERLLAMPFTLRTPLAASLSDDDRIIDTLTPQQFHILDAIQALPRVAVGGGAGAGKTIVAAEDAARAAQQGLRTLLTCVSAPLAATLKRRMEGSGVVVESFADLCRRVSGHAFTEDRGPELLHDAMLAAPDERFDAVIVDEAQDFRSHWWIAL
ncbi:MAG: NERD domain-containing protein, partial [Brevundimonas sp.]